MALSAVDRTILGMFDRLEYLSKAQGLIPATGTDFWARFDAAGDETFENYLKGFDATALDTALLTMNLGDLPQVKTILTDLVGYIGAATAYNSIPEWLAGMRLRLNYRSKLICLAGARAITAATAAGDADGGAAAPGTALGSLVRGGTITAGTDIVLAQASSSPALVRVTAIGSADWTLSLTMKLWDASTKVISQVVAGTGNEGAVGDVYVIGAQAIGGVTAAGQKVVTCADTAQYKVGQTVLLTEWTGDAPDEVWAAQETGVIASIQTNTSITLVENLLHAYSASGYIYPCFIGVSAASGSGGTAGDGASFYVAPERRLKA